MLVLIGATPEGRKEFVGFQTASEGELKAAVGRGLPTAG
jgi:hypothetical protein